MKLVVAAALAGVVGISLAGTAGAKNGNKLLDWTKTHCVDTKGVFSIIRMNALRAGYREGRLDEGSQTYSAYQLRIKAGETVTVYSGQAVQKGTRNELYRYCKVNVEPAQMDAGLALQAYIGAPQGPIQGGKATYFFSLQNGRAKVLTPNRDGSYTREAGSDLHSIEVRFYEKRTEMEHHFYQ